jgi:hypothetical protein
MHREISRVLHKFFLILIWRCLSKLVGLKDSFITMYDYDEMDDVALLEDEEEEDTDGSDMDSDDDEDEDEDM